MSLPHGYVIRPAIERFMSKVDIREGGCHEWTGGRAGEGYGYFYTGSTAPGEHGRVYAHRWAYEHFVGAIPDGLVIDHLCRNRRCVNPDHLEPVPQRVNVARGVGNGSQTHCPQGHPYDGPNLRIYRGARFCRTCSSTYHRRRRAAQKEN